MRCPYCAHEESGVIESRPTGGGEAIRRRRECEDCNKRFTTYERVGNIDLEVKKRNGDKEEFDREKLEKGIVKACWKRGVDEDQIEELVDEIEMGLLNKKSTVVESTDIGKMVLERLKEIDGVAYLRFASVYLDFENLEDFKEVIKKVND